MNITPTLEEFMTEHQPDEDVEEYTDPLESIADSLRRLVARIEQHDADEAEDDRLRASFDELDQAYAVVAGQLDQVLAICKPSTSKLANNIRAVLQPPAEADKDDVEPQSAEPASQPADDAPVEEWREYASSRGYAGADVMNRSQIRTMLGIPHGSAV